MAATKALLELLIVNLIGLEWEVFPPYLSPRNSIGLNGRTKSYFTRTEVTLYSFTCLF